MNKDKWHKWIPIEDLPKSIYLHSLTDNNNGLTLIFENEDETIKIIVNFESSAISYRNTDETGLLSTIKHWHDNYDKYFFKWPFHKSQNSSYIRWLEDERGYIDEIEHYAFITPNDIIEVLSIAPPDITVINS